MKILHVFPNEKFTVDYVTRINQLFPQKEHTFYIVSNSNGICSKEDLAFGNVMFGEIYDDTERFGNLYKNADRVILHSLFVRYAAKCSILNLMKKYDTPVVWVIWGGDLYDMYRSNHNSLNPKKILNESVRKKIISRLYGAVASGDYKVLRETYKTGAKHLYAPYTYRFIEPQPIERKDELKNIMVGHSATETCRHIEALEKLAQYSGKVRVFCPLSYPKNQAYIDKVSEEGKKLFGENFVPMTDFMPFSEYVKFLNSIDIGIFNNDRQQGNGNITNLLYLGKKVYISPENNLMEKYSEGGAVMKDVDAVGESDFLEPFSEEIQKKNHDVIADMYSDETFFKNWSDVFKG